MAEQRIDAATAELRFDAGLLGVRPIAMIDRLTSERPTAGLPGGLLGAHTVAAGCLIAAAARPQWVRAVASPSGRPDLAGEFLLIARAPTLLMVGEYDTTLRDRNQDAADRIAGPRPGRPARRRGPPDRQAGCAVTTGGDVPGLVPRALATEDRSAGGSVTGKPCAVRHSP